MKKILLAGLLLLAVFAGEALAIPYYYGAPQAAQEYFTGSDPIIVEPNYYNTTHTYTYRDYFFNQKFPIIISLIQV